jgi:hypothetical protein
MSRSHNVDLNAIDVLQDPTDFQAQPSIQAGRVNFAAMMPCSVHQERLSTESRLRCNYEETHHLEYVWNR